MFHLYEGDHNLRSQDTLIVNISRTKTNFGDRNFAISAGRLWNTIPEKLKKSPSTDSFNPTSKSIRDLTDLSQIISDIYGHIRGLY